MRYRSMRSFITVAAIVAVLLGSSTARADDLAGKGSIGVSMGAMRFTGGEDLTDGAGVRPIFHMMFKYVWAEHLVTSLEAGYGWNAYGEGGGYKGGDLSVGTLAVVTPVTLGLDYRFNMSKPNIVPRVGLGVGAYGVKILSGRDSNSRDPETDRKRSVVSPGFYGKAGAEIILNPSIALNTDILWHNTLSGDKESFPNGYLDSNVSFAELRLGINYYFTIRSTGASPRKPAEEEDDDE